MKTVFADFNAMTEAGDLRLELNGSTRDRREQNIKIGDWVWLSDGELFVGALVRADEQEGVVGTPRWRTLVHLDDDDAKDYSRIAIQLNRIQSQPSLDVDAAAQSFRLLTILGSLDAPEGVPRIPRGVFHYCRAVDLSLLDEPQLALVEIVAARNGQSGNPYYDLTYLDILSRVSPALAAEVSLTLAADPNATAKVLAACINVRSQLTLFGSDQRFETAGQEILGWIGRFDRLPDRGDVPASIVALVYLVRGLVLLRSGRRDEAHHVLRIAQQIDPSNPSIAESVGLESFDDQARDIVARLRDRASLHAA
ncbi:hypothetical protein EP7_002999 [Isosphaeraceae bacterium EP7]